MKRIAKRQFFLLGCASLAAMLLSLYDRYGIVLTSSRSFLAEQSQLQEQVLRENQEKGGNRSTGQSGKESKTMAENKAGAETETAEKDERMASDANSDIRVLLCSDNYASEYHDRITITADVPFRVSGQGTERHCQAGEQVELTMQSDELLQGDLVFTMEEDGVFQLPYLKRAAECPSYEGSLHVEKREEGLILINTLPLETYLCYVVPSEMTSSYPIEALKAQAVCARTYAALQVLGTAYEMYHADVDDTTDCQVYLPENANAAATEAVYATAGQILTWQGMIASVYYFSTSCGYTTGLEVWQQEALPYLGVHSLVQNEGMGSSADIFLRDGQVTAYDSESRFFRWRAVLQIAGNEQKLRHALQSAVSHKDGKIVLTDGAGVQTENLTSFGTLVDLGIDARSESGCVTDLRLTFENGIAHVYNENAIRNILWSICTTLTDKNGNSAHNFHMLPSAFFSVDTEEHGIYVLYGGGLGHGIGMSQYGADGMAKSGKGYVEILGTFFPGTELYTGAGK